jgi:hypothetical protein
MSDHIKQRINIFLIGILSGVMLAATFTYVFAIRANDYYWKTEISRRGGAAWTFDMKTGQMDWKWTLEPNGDAPPRKPAIVPASETKISTE